VGCFIDGKSPFGLLDMAGNVWEWTCSLWGKEMNEPEFKYPYEPTDGREDLTASSGTARVLRGGSWIFNSRGCRSAVRGRRGPGDRGDNIGFRLVLVPPGQ